jgi:hypothetical protein
MNSRNQLGNPSSAFDYWSPNYGNTQIISFNEFYPDHENISVSIFLHCSIFSLQFFFKGRYFILDTIDKFYFIINLCQNWKEMRD